jgi:hypothetical protein
MIPLPIWLTNVQFVIGAFSAFAFFAAAWLNVDSWAVRKELKTGMRAFGFLLLALWSALHGIGSEASAVTVISAGALALGALCIAVSYVIDKAPPTPKEIARRRGQEEAEKVAEVMRGPASKAKSAAVPAPAASIAPAKLAAASPLAKKSSAATPKPSPPAPGAPLTTPPSLVKPRPPKATAAPADKMGFASPSLQAKAGLRTETHVTLPKLAKRRRTRLLASVITLTVLLALGGGSAYLIVTRTNFFKPAEVPQPILIETETPTTEASPSPSPTPTPTEEPKPTVTIQETETGSLNVREGASTATPVIARVAPGEEYELLEENEAGDWYKIQVDEETAGWIAARYAEKN